jgi:glucose-6-phosphate isomerase
MTFDIKTNYTNILLKTEDNSKDLLHKFKSTVNDPDIGFFNFSSIPDISSNSKKLAKKFSHKKMLVHVGIGGSSLGPEMLINTLGIEKGKKIQFLNNIDSDYLKKQMESWQIDEIFFFVVSKSGGTSETLASLSIIVQWLDSKGISKENYNQFLVFCTDPHKGELRKISDDLDIPCLEVPSNIGGRFSVFTDVGMFPAFWAGINFDGVLLGAESIKKELLTEDMTSNLLVKVGKFLESEKMLYKNITVLMPYSSLLKDFTAWWVQLWAESLGKEGKGLTPVMAYGATDQHSQVQLFMEGPDDKVLFFINLKNRINDFELKSSLDYPNFKMLSNITLNELLYAEYYGTVKALHDTGKSFINLEIDALNEQSLGKLILFFESLTVFMGLIFNIDPFNQPGVEMGKKNALDWLSKK